MLNLVLLANSVKNVELILLGQGCWKDKVTNVCPGWVFCRKGAVWKETKDHCSCMLLDLQPGAHHSSRREGL